MITMEEKEIARKCGWCGKDMGTVKGNFNDNDITHGICDDCSKSFLDDAKELSKK